MSMDMQRFHATLFEESREGLEAMEAGLLSLEQGSRDGDLINSIFRAAHSIKGGAATFGFSDVAELTHKMESLLDRLRRHEITPIPEMVDVLLESADASRSLLARHQAGGQGEAISTHDPVRSISELASIGPRRMPRSKFSATRSTLRLSRFSSALTSG